MEFKNPFQETIIAKYDDPRDGFCLGIVVTHDGDIENFDLVEAMRAAARDYAATEAGQSDPEVLSGGFNWGDFVNTVPDEICARHGFVVEDTFVTHLIVDHDEALTAE